MTQDKCQGCAVQQGTHVRMGAVTQISEPSHSMSMSMYASKDDMLKAVMQENERLKAQLAAAQQGVQHERWCPDVCPITGRKFFMWIEHWETGKDVPTYGGPYDSYTIPVKDSDGTFSCERYDHDAGEWMTEGMGWECVGLMLVDDQSFVVEPNNPRYMEIEKFATHPTTQGLDAQTIKHISALSELVRMPNAEHFADTHNAAVRHLRAIAAQAKQGGV